MKRKFDGRILLGVFGGMSTVGAGVIKLFKSDWEIDWFFWGIAALAVVCFAVVLWLVRQRWMKVEAERLAERRAVVRRQAQVESLEPPVLTPTVSEN